MAAAERMEIIMYYEDGSKEVIRLIAGPGHPVVLKADQEIRDVTDYYTSGSRQWEPTGLATIEITGLLEDKKNPQKKVDDRILEIEV